MRRRKLNLQAEGESGHLPVIIWQHHYGREDAACRAAGHAGIVCSADFTGKQAMGNISYRLEAANHADADGMQEQPWHREVLSTDAHRCQGPALQVGLLRADSLVL